MRIFISIIISSVFFISSCKKGCTDPYATNYNANKEVDNGNCHVYDHVVLNSVKINSIPELNDLGYAWDSGFGADLDNDNSYPDLFVTFKAENGYSLTPNTYWPTIDPNNVDVTQDLSPSLSLGGWEEGGFWVYLYEIDYPFEQEFIDSVYVDPFDYDASSSRFKDTLDITQGDIQFTAYMQWFD